MNNIDGKNKAKDLIEKAHQEGYAIGAFNVANIATMKAIVNAASKLKSPIILEASIGEITYIGYQRLVYMARSYEDEYQIPIIVNLDHGKDFDSCKKAIEAGFDYVHMDGGKLPLEENIRISAKIVELAHKHNIMVEGEIDHIEGSSADHTKERPETLQRPELFTKPEQARYFVQKTGVDVFAVFIGNLHGIYAERMHLNLNLLKEIKEAIPKTYMSLHGGSGIYDEDVSKAVQLGISKVNVNSEMRIAFKMTLQDELNSTHEIAMYKILPRPIEAVQKVVEHKMKVFGSINKA